MANTDRPNGFRPVKTLSGRPWEAAVRFIGVADGEDIFIGDMVNLESGLADPMATNDAAVLGSVVGVGKMGADGVPLGPFNPDNLGKRFYDDSESTHTEWGVYVADASDCIFEVQSDSDLDYVVGGTCDLQDAAGDATTGQSRQEVTTTTNADFTIVEIPKYPDNDSSAANARYWVMVTRAEQAWA